MANKKLLTSIKVAILTAVVVISFLFSSITQRHVETTERSRIIVGAIILICMYALMVFELINRNLAAIIGAAASVAAYDCLVEKVEMEQILQWEDLETLTLLFGMMIIVNVLGRSGLFEFLALWSYRKNGGHFWALIAIMAFITAVLSAFIDNVSTMLLLSPTLIKLSELEHIDPRYVLMIMVIFCNIGGCATPVGDPPNLIIIGDPLIKKLGITFGSFFAYCGPCVLVTMGIGLFYLRTVYVSKESFRLKEHKAIMQREIETPEPDNPKQMQATLANELEVLQLIETEIHTHPKSERLRRMQKEVSDEIHLIEDRLEQMKLQMGHLTVNMESQADQRRGSRLTDAEITELMRTSSIKSKPILIQSLGVLFVTIFLFFAQSLPEINITLGWISLFAGLTLLVLSSSTKVYDEHGPANNDDSTNGSQTIEAETSENFDHAIHNIEWSTLMFFFSLFIVMEVMAKLGLMSFLGQQITWLVNHIEPGPWRTIGAITIVLWASGISSACIDNVPFTSMMIKILGTMVMDQQVHERSVGQSADVMSLKPLVFALAFGSCYGGNGTLIGASANLVTAGIAGRHGYGISFNGFAKFTLPLTIISLVIANIYLVLIFVVLDF